MHLRLPILIGLVSGVLAVLSAAPAAMAKSEAKEEGVESSSSLIEIEPLTINVFRSNYSRGKVEVIINLDVPNPALRDRVVESIPRLRAAYVQTLTGHMYDLPPRTPPNIDALAAALQRSTDKVIGRPGAKVLLGSVVVN
jgi:flagellar basal body-associated protein FliL